MVIVPCLHLFSLPWRLSILAADLFWLSHPLFVRAHPENAVTAITELTELYTPLQVNHIADCCAAWYRDRYDHTVCGSAVPDFFTWPGKHNSSSCWVDVVAALRFFGCVLAYVPPLMLYVPWITFLLPDTANSYFFTQRVKPYLEDLWDSLPLACIIRFTSRYAGC